MNQLIEQEACWPRLLLDEVVWKVVSCGSKAGSGRQAASSGQQAQRALSPLDDLAGAELELEGLVAVQGGVKLAAVLQGALNHKGGGWGSSET